MKRYSIYTCLIINLLNPCMFSYREYIRIREKNGFSTYAGKCIPVAVAENGLRRMNKSNEGPGNFPRFFEGVYNSETCSKMRDIGGLVKLPVSEKWAV